MTVAQWLEQNAPGFQELSQEEREVFAQFLFLWSLFESEALGEHASVREIERAVSAWIAKGLLTAQTFLRELTYFRDRYYSDGWFTNRFPHLHLERSGDPLVVRNVLSEQAEDPESVATALLIIVFRYRNNFFHGEKWAYELRDQDQNFANANAILTRAIELNRQAAS